MVLLAGCAVGGAEVEGSPEPRAALAAKAELAARNLARVSHGKAARGHAGRGRSEAAHRPGGAEGGKYAGMSDTAARAGDSSPQATESGTWTVLTSYDDPVADHGHGPGYADLTAVDLGEDDGMLEASVTLGSVVPGSLADREVEGVGIDLYRSGSDESDYQVFLDGGRHGWRAFLQTPSGFVRFPGSLSLRGRTLRVAVPWEAVGGREEAEVSVFVDWSTGVGRLSSDGTPRLDLLPGE